MLAMFLAIVAALVMAFLMFSVLFKSTEELKEAIYYWLKPDAWSWFDGEYEEDAWAEFKLVLWVGGSLAVGYGVYSLFQGAA